MLTVDLGVAVGLTIEYGMIRHGLVITSGLRRGAVALFILLVFSGIWLSASGSLIYLGSAFQWSLMNWLIAFVLAMFGTFVLVPLKRVMPEIGSGIAVCLVFNAVVFFILVLCLGASSYFPWGITPIILFELLLSRLARRVGSKQAGLFSSFVTGGFFGVVYYPFTVHLFPWAFFLQPLLFVPLVGSVVGALLGNSVYAALTSVVLGEVAGSF
jgi:hypothetical protein